MTIDDRRTGDIRIHARPAFGVVLGALLLLSACGRSGDSNRGPDSKGGRDSSRAHAAGQTPKTADETPSRSGGMNGPFLLAYRFPAGTNFVYDISNLEYSVVTSDTTVNENRQTVTYRYRFDVREILPGGSMRCDARLERVHFDGTYRSGGTNTSLSYHSDDKNDAGKERRFARYGAAVGQTYRFVLDPNGMVHSIDGLDAILRRLLGPDYATTKQATKQTLAENYADNSLKSVIQLVFQRLETHPVPLDSAWIVKWNGELGYFKLSYEGKYSLRSLEKTASGTRAHIDVGLNAYHLGEKRFDTGQGIATIDKFDVSGKGESVLDFGAHPRGSRKLQSKVFVKMWIEVPEELKKMAPDQARDFWLTQDARVENTITPVGS